MTDKQEKDPFEMEILQEQEHTPNNIKEQEENPKVDTVEEKRKYYTEEPEDEDITTEEENVQSPEEQDKQNYEKNEFQRRFIYILISIGLSFTLFHSNVQMIIVPFTILIALFFAIDIRIGFIENLFIKEKDKRHKFFKVFNGRFQK